MALPSLDATFASAADLPRRMMLAQWLVNIQYTGSVADYATLPERYLWAKIAVAAGGPKDEAAYIGLPKQYVWKDIYDAVSGASAGIIDWHEKQALGHIAAAYRGDTANPANLATYIDWPWRYQVASIIGHIMGNYNAIIVSGSGTATANGTYLKQAALQNGKPYYIYAANEITFNGSIWEIIDSPTLGGDAAYQSSNNTQFPWEATFTIANGSSPIPTLTPTNV